jgi:hypothetical protein
MKRNSAGNKVGVVVLTLLLLTSILAMPLQAGANEIKVYVNGEEVIFDDPPRIEGGRTLVPLRAIAEAMGMPIDWDESTSTITISHDKITLKMIIGSSSPTINGELVPIEVPARIINGRTFVPVRFISDAFGSDVAWLGDSRTIRVNSKQHIKVENTNNIRIQVQIFNSCDGCKDLAALIMASCDGEEETVLIMSGNCPNAYRIMEKMENNGLGTIDQLIVTTPFDEDSAGIQEIYHNFRVRDTILSKASRTMDAYEEFMQENYPNFPLQKDIQDVSELIPDVSKLIPDISELVPDLSGII